MDMGMRDDGTIYFIEQDAWLTWPVDTTSWREQYGYAMREMQAHLEYVNRKHLQEQAVIATLKEQIESLKDRLYEYED